MNNKVLRLTQVINLTGLSRSTIDRLESEGSFPSRRKIGAKAVGWLETEVEKWIQQLALKNPEINKTSEGKPDE